MQLAPQMSQVLSLSSFTLIRPTAFLISVRVGRLAEPLLNEAESPVGHHYVPRSTCEQAEPARSKITFRLRDLVVMEQVGNTEHCPPESLGRVAPELAHRLLGIVARDDGGELFDDLAGLALDT